MESKSKNILDENTYVQKIEKIIERDFYPDLPKLHAQAEFIDATEQNDLVKLRQIHNKYSVKEGETSLYETPLSFDTPESHNSERRTLLEQCDGDPSNKSEATSAHDFNSCLDNFFAKNTSEDNASFDEIQKESQKKEKLKNVWLYDMEKEHNDKYEQQCCLPTIEAQAIESGQSSLGNWQYHTRNSLMYIPDGASRTAAEIAADKAKMKVITHSNTRFVEKPFSKPLSRSKLQEAAASQSLMQQGKIGPDGKELISNPTPRNNGYNFVAPMPSPAPGVNESPLMTWGEINGTPFRLDGSDTPASNSSGPIFKIPAVPARDEILLQLSEQASKSHRAKKKQALKHITSSLTSSPGFGKSPIDIINSLSPAARQLATNKLGVRTHSDKALRVSYTPSPRSTCSSSHSTRKSKRPSPWLEVSPKITPVNSITDNLLNLPKRSKASDYF